MIQEKSQLYKKLIQGKELSLAEAEKFGNSNEIDKEIPIKYITRGDNSLGPRCYDNIHRISYLKENLVAKTERGKGEVTQKDFDMQDDIYKSGINCPKPTGLFNVYNVEKQKFQKSFVMEEIKNVNPIDKQDLNKEKIREKVKNEYRKAEKSGFTPVDKKPANKLFDSKTNKCYLIDFEFWRKGEQEFHSPW